MDHPGVQACVHGRSIDSDRLRNRLFHPNKKPPPCGEG
ncbi:hypothetical protein SynA1562_02128 [Synechococcus sp. A15-62]|nr:hypothetical protein SynA1562_02128 [Synechococcus sp. A15-62]